MSEETGKYTEEVYVSKEVSCMRASIANRSCADAVAEAREDYRTLRRSFRFDDLHADICSLTRALRGSCMQTTEQAVSFIWQRPFCGCSKKASYLQELSALMHRAH